MSLIVAKKYNTHLYVVGDTCINNPNNLNQVVLAAPAEYSQIKSLIINPHICVSFAGEKEPAQVALLECRKFDYKVNDLLNYLLKVNKDTDHRTEFIVCANFPPFYLYEIKNGEKKLVDSTWIGSIEGFNVFQQNYYRANGNDSFKKMKDAMTAVIESNVQEVNGFLVSVSNLRGQFLYENYIKTYIPPRSMVGPGFHVIKYGTVHEGGYTVHVLPSDLINILAVHIPQNRMGLIYKLQNTGLLEPEVFMDVDEHEFTEITNEKHGIKPLYCISSNQVSFFERGNRESEKRSFERAIVFYDLGLKVNEDNLKPLLHFNKGVCYCHLKKPEDGLNCFKEAVKLNPTMQSKVIQFLSGFGTQKPRK